MKNVCRERTIFLVGFTMAAFALTASSSAGAAGENCTKADQKAISQANKMLAVMIENVPMECVAIPESGKCGVICATTYSMTTEQRNGDLVWVTGAMGLYFNKRGVSRFTKLYYVDRDLAHESMGLVADAATIADIQRRAKSDQIAAPQVIFEVKRAFKQKTRPKH